MLQKHSHPVPQQAKEKRKIQTHQPTSKVFQENIPGLSIEQTHK